MGQDLVPAGYTLTQFVMLVARTLFSSFFVSASLLCLAATDTSFTKASAASNNTTINSGVSYTIHLNNKANNNHTVDSVLVILDKFDRSGAGVVKKVLYPNADNQVLLADVPAGKYYAEVYVLGLYKKHFSQVIRANKRVKHNRLRLQMDYNDVYIPGQLQLPPENLSLFAYIR